MMYRGTPPRRDQRLEYPRPLKGPGTRVWGNRPCARTNKLKTLPCLVLRSRAAKIEVFAKSPDYKNANIEVCHLKQIRSVKFATFLVSHCFF